MQISARSYLTAGVSLTTAAAIALTPLAIPTQDRTVSIPSVTVSDIQLTVTPIEVQEFFDNLQLRIVQFNATVAEAASVPGQTLTNGLRSAMELNDQIYTSLIDATNNPTLQALLETLQISTDRSLRSLAFFVEDSNQTIVVAGKDIADLLSGMVTGSLSNVLAATVDVLNNPTSFRKYAHVLAAAVGSGALMVNGTGLAVQKAGNAGFDVAFGGIELMRTEITTALDTVRRLAFVGAGATGSPLVQAVVSAVTTISFAPAYLSVRIPSSVAGETVLSAQSAFNTLLNGVSGYQDAQGQYVPGVATAVGTALAGAIDEIGRGPLDPQRYLAATALVIAGGFDATNISINTVGTLAQVPFDWGINLISPEAERANVTRVLMLTNVQLANSISNLLATLGLSEDIASLPMTVAQQVNDTIYNTTLTVADGLADVNASIAGGTDLIVSVSNDIENAILGALSGEETEPPASGGDDEPADNEPVIIVPPVGDSTDDEDDTEDEVTDPDDFIVDDWDDTDWDDDDKFGDADESTDPDELIIDDADDTSLDDTASEDDDKFGDPTDTETDTDTGEDADASDDTTPSDNSNSDADSNSETAAAA